MEAGLIPLHARVTGAMMIDAVHEALYDRMRMHRELRGLDMTTHSYQPEINLRIQLPECAWKDESHKLIECLAWQSMQICKPSMNTSSWPWSQLHQGSGNHSCYSCCKQYTGAQLNQTWNQSDISASHIRPACLQASKRPKGR